MNVLLLKPKYSVYQIDLFDGGTAAVLKRSQGQRFCHPKLFIILIYTCNEYHFLQFWPTDFEGWAHNINIYDFGISSSKN